MCISPLQDPWTHDCIVMHGCRASIMLQAPAAACIVLRAPAAVRIVLNGGLACIVLQTWPWAWAH